MQVLIQPRVSTPKDDVQYIRLDIRFNSADVVGKFDRIEVHRSKISSAGPYEELTADGFQPAVVPAGAVEASVPSTEPTFSVSGLNLVVVVNSMAYNYTFTGVNPLTLTDVVSQLSSAHPSVFSAFPTDRGQLALKTYGLGQSVRLTVDGGDAAPVLHLPIDPPANTSRGKSPRLGVYEWVDAYDFLDFFGSRTYWYKTRFRNSLNDSVSEFSIPFSLKSSSGLSSEHLVVGVVELVDGEGSPVQGRKVQLYAHQPQALVDGKYVLAGEVTRYTDEAGRVEFPTIRGLKYTLSISGADIVREVVAPTSPEIYVYDLLGEGSTSDAFEVVIPHVITAERRSL